MSGPFPFPKKCVGYLVNVFMARQNMVDGDTSNAGGPATVRQTLGHTTLNAGPEAEGFTFARSQTLLSRVWWLAYPTKTVSSGDSVFAPPELGIRWLAINGS